ncbi:MAG: hypothetical protein NZ849_00195 [Meiothermus sp.]|uniref:hypothetical protein n=1 Tax=Meiothermus sp. TaxID=1955249 RepID=UPI0025FEDF04|nr:hypothetical protein [Meiothermus sp.]MCS7058149.1 hypothetical protein [Meiothermus sp.]MCS7193336.1 hypothetical protein [Meiothermus sp.]MCX7741136.1 hypothetical protein [Meiothermus sp.]MDW8091230.1 hypothetical protein [Meiothermus sp.]MDW8481984.1 hypothetical protein [Meiothermus sp.]
MRTSGAALWLELLGGLLVVLGAFLAALSYLLATQTVDPSLERNLLRVRIDLAGLLDTLALRMATAGAWAAGVGAVLFFGAGYLAALARWAVALAALLALGVWLWLALFR